MLLNKLMVSNSAVRSAIVIATLGILSLLAACAGMPGQSATGYGQSPRDACAALRSPPAPATALPTGSLGALAPLGGVIKQVEQNQRQANAQQRAALARECAPHPQSAMYVAPLTPVSDVKSVVNGKTLYLDTAIVANHQLLRMQEDVMYLASNGKSYTSSWEDKRWSVQDNAVCIYGAQDVCMPMFKDAANDIFVGSTTGLLLKLARTEPGDSAHVRAAYAQNMRDKAKRDEMAAALVGIFVQAAISGSQDSSGGRDCSRSTGRGCSSDQIDNINHENTVRYWEHMNSRE